MPKGYWVAHVDVENMDQYKKYVTAKACYQSPEYQAAKALRVAHALSDLVIVNGWDG